MSWIQGVSPDHATGALKSLYEHIGSHSSRGQVSYLWQACGLDPAGLEVSFAHYRALMDDPSPLTMAQAELIALVVSATNGCGYCVAHHGPRLARALGDESLARAVARDYREANLEDIERVREYGFDDAAILKATQITAYYNFINRVASGLGVALEPGIEPWEFGSQK